MEFLEKGKVLESEGKLEEAAVLYDKAIQTNSNCAEAYYRKGNILGDMGKNSEAIVFYDKAISLDPSHVNSYNNKGIALRALGKDEEAVLCYDKAIKLDPADAYFYHNKGNALTELGKNKEAIICYDEAIRLNPNHSDFYQSKGVAFEDMGKYQEAILCYETAISINPDYAHAHHKKGNILADLDKNEEAIVSYDRAISLNPDFAISHHNKGLALRALGKYEEAIVCYDKAIDLDPTDPDFYHNKGVALGYLGKNTEAIAFYDKFINLNPNSANVYYNKGVALEAVGEKEEALIYYDKALSLNPYYSEAFNNKGIALRALGRHEDALACYDKAIHFSNFKEPLYYCNRGRLLNELDQPEKALKDFKAANNLVQQDVWGSVSAGNKIFISQMLSTILELEKRTNDTKQILIHLDQDDSDVQSAMDQFKKIQREKSDFVNQQVAKLDEKKDVSQEDLQKANEKIQDLRKHLEQLNEKLAQLTERVAVMEKTVQEMKNNIEKMREDMKTSGILDKVRIVEGFKDLEKNAPQLYAYAKAFYWTLMNYFMAYRNSSTRIVQGNTESATKDAEKYVASTASYVFEFGIDMIESVPFVEKIMRILNETIKMTYENIKERRFENRVNIINKIIMEHNLEDEVNTTVAFTALDVAFKLRAGNSFDFDVIKSENTWEKVQGNLSEQIEKIKNLVLAESIDLYEGPAATAALRDVLLLLAYLYERFEFILVQKQNQQKPFYDQFANIILLKKYTEIIGKNQDVEFLKTPSYTCGDSCMLF